MGSAITAAVEMMLKDNRVWKDVEEGIKTVSLELEPSSKNLATYKAYGMLLAIYISMHWVLPPTVSPALVLCLVRPSTEDLTQEMTWINSLFPSTARTLQQWPTDYTIPLPEDNPTVGHMASNVFNTSVHRLLNLSITCFG